VCPEPLPDACSAPTCNPQTGKCEPIPLALGVTCNDGIECTTGDACDGKGVCKAGATTCRTSDADCAGQEDGNFCNGTLYCHLATGNCVLNPLTVVTCPSVDDTACTTLQCQPKTGKCAPVAKPGKTPCSDSNSCTVGDTCQAGKCTGSATTCQCFTDADCALKDDGNKCNGTLYCDQKDGTCKLNPATVVLCQSVYDTACTTHSCNPLTGGCEATLKLDGTPCDADGTSCTADDQCLGGFCNAGTSTCVCQTNADCTKKDDGNLCNGSLYCELKGHTCVLNPATGVSVLGGSKNDTVYAAVPAGLGFAAVGTTESSGTGAKDGWLLRVDAFANAACGTAGTCLGKSIQGCSDQNACTFDYRTAQKACTHKPMPDSQDCGIGNQCKQGVCK
jgi:hypothetical protein